MPVVQPRSACPSRALCSRRTHPLVLTEAPSFFRRGRDRDAPVLTSTRRNEADTGVEIRFPHEAAAEQQFEPGRNTTERSRGRDEKPRQQNKPKHMRKPGSNPALGRTQ